MKQQELVLFLDRCVDRFNEPGFIADDPICIPHGFSQLQNREIMGFWVATLAWGQRKTIIRNALRLIELMDGAPYDFILHHQEADRARFANFKHRTFQYTDTLYFLEFLQWHYRQHDSLEVAFSQFLTPASPDVGPALGGFHDYFFSLPDSPRARVSMSLRLCESRVVNASICSCVGWCVKMNAALILVIGRASSPHS